MALVLLLASLAHAGTAGRHVLNIDDYGIAPGEPVLESFKTNSSARDIASRSGFTASYEKMTVCSKEGVCETQMVVENQAGPIRDFKVDFDYGFDGGARRVTLWQSSGERWVPVDPEHFTFLSGGNKSLMLRYEVEPCSNGTWELSFFSPYGPVSAGGRYASVCEAEKASKVENAADRGEGHDVSVNDDGSKSIVLYAGAANYWDGKRYVPIDRTAKEIGLEDERHGLDYRFGFRGTYDAYFKTGLNSEWPVAVEIGDEEVRMRPFGIAYNDGTQYRYIQVASDSVGIPNRDSITYEDVFTGVDVVYIYQGRTLKERIVLKQDFRNYANGLGLDPNAEIQFISLVDYGGLEPSVPLDENTGKRIDFRKGEELLFSFEPAFAKDSSKAFVEGEEVEYPDVWDAPAKITEIAGKKYYIVSVPLYWLQRSVYPVEIDPTLTTYGGDYGLADIYSREDNVDMDTEIQVKWNISAVPPGVTINDATLCLYAYTVYGSIDSDANLSRIDNQTWDESVGASEYDAMAVTNNTESETWSSTSESTFWCINVTAQLQTDHDAGNENFTVRVGDPDAAVYSTTAIVDDLYFGDIYNDGGSAAYGHFYQRTHGTESQRPYLNVTYTGQEACGTITTNTTLTSNLTTTGDCITFGASDIWLDCAGYTIDGDESSGDYGIYASSKSNIALRNCIIKDFQIGVYWNNADNSLIENTTVYDITPSTSAYGTYLLNNDNTTVRDSVIKEIRGTSTTQALYLSTCTNMSVYNVSITNINSSGNVVRGLYLNNMDDSYFYNITIADINASNSGADGANGYAAYGIATTSTSYNDNILLENSTIDGVHGGDGNSGGKTTTGGDGGIGYGFYCYYSRYWNIRNVTFRDISGGNGGQGGGSRSGAYDGGPGGDVYAIYESAQCYDSNLTNTTIYDVSGGHGGTYGTGGFLLTPLQGGSGGDALAMSNQDIFTYISGTHIEKIVAGYAANATLGGNGTNGGRAYGFYISDTNSRIENSSVKEIVGGRGGNGGSVVLFDGDGGNGGDGGTSRGGYLGSGIVAINVSIEGIEGGDGGIAGQGGEPPGQDGSPGIPGDARGLGGGANGIINNCSIVNVTGGADGGIGAGFHPAGGDNTNVSNSTFADIADYDADLRVANSQNHIFLNNTFNKSKIGVGSGSDLTIKWYARVNVTSPNGNPISGAEVNISDLDGTERMVLNITGSDGLTGYVEVQEEQRTYDENRTYNNHTVNVSGAGQFNTTSFNITNTVTINLTLARDDVLPDITWEDPTPADGSTVGYDWVYLNATVDDSSKTSAFFDWNYSLRGYWSMDSYDGDGVKDNSSFGNNCTFNGSMTTSNITEGKFGMGADFDGLSSYMDCGLDPSLDITDAITVEAWIKGDDVADRRIISKHGPAGDNGWALFTESGGTFEWRVSTTGSDWNGGSTSAGSYSAGQWYHVVATYDGSYMRVFINGVEDTGGNFPLGLSGSINIADSSLRIGTDYWGGTEFDGVIDEVKVYARNLSEQEINASFNNSAHRLEANFTSLNDTWTYDYAAYAIDANGNLNITSTRNVTIDVVACGDTITTDTNLAVDLSTAGDCLTFGASDLYLNCSGHTISGDGGSGDIGVDTNGQTNVTIRDCIISEFQYDIYMNSCHNCTADNNTLTGTGSGKGTHHRYGLYSTGSQELNVINNYIHNITSVASSYASSAGYVYGIDIASGSGILIENNTIANLTAGWGASGSSPTAGRYCYGIYTLTDTTAKNNDIGNITAGEGGYGTNRYSTSAAYAGAAGGNAYGIYINTATDSYFIDNNISIITGGKGGNGGNNTYTGAGGAGGSGGYAYGHYLDGGGHYSIGNNMTNITGGRGGNGGTTGGSFEGSGGAGGKANALYLLDGSNYVDDTYISYSTGGKGGDAPSPLGGGKRGSGGVAYGAYLASSSDTFNFTTIKNVTEGKTGDVGDFWIILGMDGGCGVKLAADSYSFTNSSISETSDYDLCTGGNSQGSIFLNCSLDRSKIYWGQRSLEDQNITIKWYIQVNVSNATDGSPISGAVVNASDIDGNWPMLLNTTDANGLTDWVVAGDVVVIKPGVVGSQTEDSFNNHTINASFGVLLFNTTEVNVTDNMVINLTLSEIPGSACGTITVDTTLLNNVSIDGSTCIVFGVGDITLDCDGYTITGNNTRFAYGVDTKGTDNIVIRNCRIRQFATGINVNYSDNVNMYNNTVYDSYLLADSFYGDAIGVHLTNSSNVNVTNHTDWNISVSRGGVEDAGGYGYGLYIDGSNNTIVHNYTGGNHSGDWDDLVKSYTSGYGAYVEDSGNVSLGLLSLKNMSAGYGIRVLGTCYPNVTVESASVDNASYGMYFYCPATVTNATVNDSIMGIYIKADWSNVSGFTLYNASNAALGLWGNNCSIENGTIRNPAGNGISFVSTSYSNVFRNIDVNQSDRGISVGNGGDSAFYNVTVDNVNYGAYINLGDRNNFTDCRFYQTGSTLATVYAGGGAVNNIFLNSTGNYSNSTVVSGDFLVQWYARVNVTDISGVPIENASVNISDINGSIAMLEDLTGADGLTDYVIVNDTNYSDVGNTSFNNNTVNASYGIGFNSTSWNIISTCTINITLNTIPELSFTITLPASGCTEGKGCVTGGCSACTRAWIETNDTTGASNEACVSPEGQSEGSFIPFLNFTNTGNVNLNWTIKLNESLSATFKLNISGDDQTAAHPDCGGSSEVTTTFQLVWGDLAPGSYAHGWLYGEFINALYGNESRELNHTSEQS